MNTSPQDRRVRSNLRALFVLAFFLSLLMSGSGGFVLAFGWSHQNITFKMPAWQYGQFLLLLGLANVFIYICLFFQVRKLLGREHPGPILDMAAPGKQPCAARAPTAATHGAR